MTGILLLGRTEFMGERYPAYKVAAADVAGVWPVDEDAPDGPSVLTIQQEGVGTYSVVTDDSASSILARLAGNG